MKSTSLRRSLPWWGASALIPAVLAAAFAAPTAPIHAAPAPFDWWVACGDVIPHRPMVREGTEIVVQEFRGAEHHVDAEMAEFLANRDRAEAAAQAAFISHLQQGGYFYDLSCGPCENQNTCVIWPIAYEPGLAFSFETITYPGGGHVQILIEEDFFVTAMCTDC